MEASIFTEHIPHIRRILKPQSCIDIQMIIVIIIIMMLLDFLLQGSFISSASSVHLTCIYLHVEVSKHLTFNHFI